MKKGGSLSEETKKKMSESHKGKPNAGTFVKGFVPWNKGLSGYKTQPCSEERKRKIGAANAIILKGRKQSVETRLKRSLAFKGERNHKWEGGKTSPETRIRHSIEYKLWRESVYARDDWTCVMCGERGGKLNADHIKPFALFPQLRFEVSNGRTLCVLHHAEVTKEQHLSGLFPESVRTRFKSTKTAQNA